jgi:hypothetical protein
MTLLIKRVMTPLAGAGTLGLEEPGHPSPALQTIPPAASTQSLEKVSQGRPELHCCQRDHQWLQHIYLIYPYPSTPTVVLAWFPLRPPPFWVV